MASDVGHDPRAEFCKNGYPPRRLGVRWGGCVDSRDETMRVVVVQSTGSCFMKAFLFLSILEHGQGNVIQRPVVGADEEIRHNLN